MQITKEDIDRAARHLNAARDAAGGSDEDQVRGMAAHVDVDNPIEMLAILSQVYGALGILVATGILFGLDIAQSRDPQ